MTVFLAIEDQILIGFNERLLLIRQLVCLTGRRIQLLDLFLVGLDEEVLQLQVGRALIGVTPEEENMNIGYQIPTFMPFMLSLCASSARNLVRYKFSDDLMPIQGRMAK